MLDVRAGNGAGVVDGRGPDGHGPSLWNTMAAAVARFSESTPELIGMRTRWSTAASAASAETGAFGAEQEGDALGRVRGEVADRGGVTARYEGDSGEARRPHPRRCRRECGSA